MVKIWAKIYRDKRIARDMVYTSDQLFRAEDLFSYLQEICADFDIPVPVLMKNHVRNLSEFHNVKIKATAFIETVDFEYLQLEDVGS